MIYIFILALLFLGSDAVPHTSPHGPYSIIRMRKLGTGLLAVPVDIDGRNFWFFVDTGAGRSVVPPELAKRLKLTPRREGTASGIGATTLRVYEAELPTVKIGPIKQDGIRVVVADLPRGLTNGSDALSIDGILGSDLLNLYESVIDYKNLRLYMRDDKRYLQRLLRGEWISVSLSTESGRAINNTVNQINILTIGDSVFLYVLSRPTEAQEVYLQPLAAEPDKSKSVGAIKFVRAPGSVLYKVDGDSLTISVPATSPLFNGLVPAIIDCKAVLIEFKRVKP